MKNLKWIIFVLLISVFISFIIFSSFNDSEKKQKESTVDLLEIKVDETIKNMTLDEKIGQMIIINYNVSEINDDLITILKDVKPSGFILMQNNYSTFEATKKLVSDIKSYSNLPFIVSTDQEGGRVQRLQLLNDVNPINIPSMKRVGEMNDEDISYGVGKVIAEEVRTLGINVVHAPVVDVFSNPNNKVIGDRSFGSDASLVSKMAISMANGLEDNGVISTYKHFPGHGDTLIDSHNSLPIVAKSYDELYNLEFKPFKDVIDNGALMIMTAHVALPNVTDDNTPATMSKEIVNGILREKLGYDGIVISDALNMKALTNYYSDEEIYKKTVEAGVDILLMPRDPRLAFNTIKNNISEERIDESVRRILKLKFKYLEKDNILDNTYIDSESHREIIDKIN